MSHLFFFSGSITAFFLLLLLSKRNKATYDQLLIVWFAVILFHLVVFYLESFNRFVFLLEISSAAVFLDGPLLWLYTRQLTQNKIHGTWKVSLHFVPFLINLFIIGPYVIQGALVPLPGFARDLLTLGKLTSILLYVRATLTEIKQHKLRAQENLSNLEASHLKWLQLVVYGILGIWLIGIISQVAFFAPIMPLPRAYEDLAVNVAVSLFVIIIGYYGFMQAPVFIKNEIATTLKQEYSNEKEISWKPDKYKKSGINEEKVLDYAARLTNFMISHKPFTDPELTLGKLAAQLEMSPNHLSQIINEHHQKSFYDFVNTYRVEEVKKVLETNAADNLTLLGIALDAGFNSKASFNRYFKKQTNQTPSGYLKTLKAAQPK